MTLSMTSNDLPRPFQFGESQKLRLVRILRSTVMVRVGGGWVALDEFLVKNDPCRGESIQSIDGKLRFDHIRRRDAIYSPENGTYFDTPT